jgi:hypothetical protein
MQQLRQHPKPGDLVGMLSYVSPGCDEPLATPVLIACLVIRVADGSVKQSSPVKGWRGPYAVVFEPSSRMQIQIVPISELFEVVEVTS